MRIRLLDHNSEIGNVAGDGGGGKIKVVIEIKGRIMVQMMVTVKV